MCDVVYTLIVDDLRERVATERAIAAQANIMRGAESELPVWDIEWERFDDYLDSAPAPVSPETQERYELLHALGLRG